MQTSHATCRDSEKRISYASTKIGATGDGTARFERVCFCYNK
jgi:hypothetical protein